MKITQDQFASYVLHELLWTKAKLVALEKTFFSVLKNVGIEDQTAFEAAFQKLEDEIRQSLYIAHPFAKDDLEDLLRQNGPD